MSTQNKWAKIESKHKVKSNLSFILWKKVPGVQDVPGKQLHQMLASTTASDPMPQPSGPYRNKPKSTHTVFLILFPWLTFTV